MKAICIEKPGEVVLKEVPDPVRKPGEAMIRIKAVMLCGSDISAYRGKNELISFPRIIGHEVAGEIVEIGEEPGGLAVGDHVLLNPYVFCGNCNSCAQGRTNACENLRVLGVQTDGAMSEFFSHPVDLLIKVPGDMPWDIVPLAEPLTISLHALHRAGLKEGEFAVIIGAGPIGIYAAQAALAYGATPIVLDIIDARLDIARSYGAKYTVNTLGQDSVKAIYEITGGRMAEVVVEASGCSSEIGKSLSYASSLGRIALTGWPAGETSLNTPMITLKELDVKGSRTGVKDELEEALAMINTGAVDVRSVLSEVVDFDRIPDAVRRIDESPQDYLKIGALL
jgi:threonine dehydrogenase-like Zn-dependent dehydrogenase